MIFGCTDLRKGVSGAKFDAEADFEVRRAVALQKPGQNSEKLKFRSENFAEKKFSTSKKRKSANCSDRYFSFSLV